MTNGDNDTRLPDDALADIQGFITSGYGHLPHAAYLFVQFHDAAAAQALARKRRCRPSRRRAPWPTLPSGEKIKPASAVNVAFTAAGLAALGVPDERAVHVPGRVPGGHRAASTARESSATPKRARPATWELGGPTLPPIHAVRPRFTRSRPPSSSAPATRSARSSPRRAAASSSWKAACRAATARRATTSRSGFTTASRSRRLPASAARAFPRASSSSATRITTESCRRRRSCRRSSMPAGCCRRSRTHIMRRSGCGTSARTDRSSSIGSCSRTSPASGSS